MHFLSKNYSCCPKKALFCPESSKKCVNRCKSLYRDKIAYVSAWNFRPSPNFSAKALPAFAQLLSPCLKVRLFMTILYLKLFLHVPFGKFCIWQILVVIVVTNMRWSSFHHSFINFRFVHYSFIHLFNPSFIHFSLPLPQPNTSKRTS